MKKIIVLALIAFLGAFGLHAQDNSLHFDGTNDAVDLPENTNLAFPANTSVTIEAWVNTSSSALGFVFGNQNCTGGNEVLFGVNSGRAWARIRGVASTSGSFLLLQTGSTAINDGLWHHIAMVHDIPNSLLSVYVDGNLDGQTLDTITGPLTATNPFNWIGRREGCGGINNFNGQMDEVRIWKTALTQTQIQGAMCNSISSSSPGLAAYYDFNQGTAGGNNTGLTTLPDLVGGSDGTLMNFALSGTTSNWVGSTAFQSAPCQSVTVPTLSEWGLIILGLFILCVGAVVIWRRRAVLETA